MCASVFARAKTDTRAPLERPRYLRGAYIMNHKKLLLTLTLCLCALLCTVVTASASEVQEHSHPVCGKTHTDIGDHTEDKCSTPTWTKLYMDGDGKLCYGEGQQVTYDSAFDYYRLPAGTYYLGTDLTLNRGIQIDSNGGDVTLCLNGKMISCGTGAAIQVKGVNNKNITFTLCDCEGSGVITHTGNDENDKGGNGVDVANSNNGGNNEVAKFIMYNGHITKNKGSGVYLNDSTSFTMYGGRITQNGYNNTSLFGGYGGGVYVASEASFTMYGGSITENHANKSGGGIYSTSNNISIYGGGVTNNSVTKNGKAGGIYVSSSDTLTVGGNVNISGNWQGDSKESGSKSNVYLNGNTSGSSATIVIEKKLTGENSRIGVTTATSVATTPNASVKIAAGKGTHAITDVDKGHFTPDTGYCEVQKKNDGIYLTHVHSGGTATCTAKAKCGGCNAPYGDALGHDFVHHDAQPATCTAKGLEAYDTCSRCDYSTTKVEIPMADHTYSATEWESNVDNHWHECSACHTQIDKAEHTWKDATTSAPKTCTVCGATTGTKLSAYYYYSPAKTEDTPGSPKAGDPGVLLYAGLALASLTGLACTAKKRH